MGLSLARALRGSGLRIALIDRAPPSPPLAHPLADWDARVYAISPGSRAFLESLEAWPAHFPERLASVSAMHVRGDAGGAIRFDAVEARAVRLATIAENRLLLDALWRAVESQTEVQVFAPAVCADLALDPEAADGNGEPAGLTLEDGTSLASALVVAADGAHSWVRTQAGLQARTTRYHQTAVVANFACERPHRGTAFQWFLQRSVLALLPLPGNRCSLVWSAEEGLAAELMNGSPQELAERVAGASGHVLGALEQITRPVAFPLQLVQVEHLIGPRLALVGDAAHNLHPLAGQGVNLGFHDARELAYTLQHRGACRNVGERRLLRRYERARREDILAMTAATDGLQRLFSNSGSALSLIRNRGLSMVDRVAPLKRMLVRHALG